LFLFITIAEDETFESCNTFRRNEKYSDNLVRKQEGKRPT